MIRRSFIHLPGVGLTTERKLWSRGILSWDDLRNDLRRNDQGIFGTERSALMLQLLDEGEKALERSELSYFYRAFPRDQLWRLLPGVLDRVAYLDIETTGMGLPPSAHSTTITFYYRGELLQEHEPEKKRKLVQRMLREPLVWVSYFGEGFDVPFLEREFQFKLDLAHVDLCFWLRRHGYKGGLKKVQKRFPDIPERHSLDINGYDAVLLWRMHQRGVPRALETLLTYNAEDTVVLAALLVKAFNLEVARHHSFASALELAPLADPVLPELSTGICRKVYAMLRENAALTT